MVSLSRLNKFNLRIRISYAVVDFNCPRIKKKDVPSAPMASLLLDIDVEHGNHRVSNFRTEKRLDL